MYTIGEVLHGIQEIPLVYKGLCGIIAITWVLNSRRKRVRHHLVEYKKNLITNRVILIFQGRHSNVWWHSLVLEYLIDHPAESSRS
jgi:hypothetical protein